MGNMNSITNKITNSLFYQWYVILNDEITDEMMSIIFFDAIFSSVTLSVIILPTE
jgi:hypothetical protein